MTNLFSLWSFSLFQNSYFYTSAFTCNIWVSLEYSQQPAGEPCPGNWVCGLTVICAMSGKLKNSKPKYNHNLSLFLFKWNILHSSFHTVNCSWLHFSTFVSVFRIPFLLLELMYCSLKCLQHRHWLPIRNNTFQDGQVFQVLFELSPVNTHESRMKREAC